jgi:site-specific DNA recombinase
VCKRAVPFGFSQKVSDKMTQNNKSVILARVSTKEQKEGFSLPAQEKLMRRYADDKKIEVVKVFQIAETASKSKQRTVFNQMMVYVDRSKIKKIVVEKADRITRSFHDMVMIDDWLEADSEREIHLVKDVLVMHRGSRSQDKLNWGVKVLFAKNYIDNLREEVNKGMNEKLEQGWLPGTPPPGYKNHVSEDRRIIQAIDDKKAPLIRLMFELYDSGNYSLSMLAKEMKSAGLTTSRDKFLPKSSIHRLLNSKYYIGIIGWNGKEYHGKHTPIIDEELYESVRTRLTRKTPPSYIKHKPLLSGKIKCDDCGSSITWYTAKNMWYGQCKGLKPCVAIKECAKLNEVEDAFVDYFDALIAPSPAIMAWVRKELISDHKSDIERHALASESLVRQSKRLQSQMDLLYEDRIDKRISPEKYDMMIADKEHELEEVEKSITRLNKSMSNYRERGVEIINLTQTATEVYTTSDKDTKRALLGDIFSNITLNGKHLEVVWREETDIVRRAVEKTKRLETYFEPSADPSKLVLSEASRSIWCRVEDSNLRTR